MLREIAHLVRHTPATLRLKSKVPQAELYETLIARADEAGLGAQREALVTDLRGEVVEIGCGTGSMFRHYAAGTRVSAVEPDPEFAARARGRIREAAATIEVVDGTGEALPFADARFDAAVLGLVLCSVPRVEAVLAEVRRVVKPGGTLRLIEHVRSERRVAGWLMDRVDGLWLKLNGQGCHLNRDPLPDLTAAGFTIDDVVPFQVWSAGIPAFPMRRITAVR